MLFAGLSAEMAGISRAQATASRFLSLPASAEDRLQRRSAGREFLDEVIPKSSRNGAKSRCGGAKKRLQVRLIEVVLSIRASGGLPITSAEGATAFSTPGQGLFQPANRSPGTPVLPQALGGC